MTLFDLGSPWQHRSPSTPLSAKRHNDREQAIVDKINEQGGVLQSVGTRVEIIDEIAWAHDPQFGGAEPDDPTVNNDTAFRAGFDVLTARGGGELNLIPGKTYGWASSSVVANVHGVTLKGNGATLQHIPGLASPDTQAFGVWTKCDDIAIVDLNVDLNNIERFGGFQIQGCARPRVERVHALDSNLNASWASYDHYSFVFNKADDGTPCTDVKMYDIQADDVELVEADNCKGFVLSRFVSRRAAGTVGVGLFTVQSGETALDYEISHGRIVDARRRWMSLSHETGGPDNNTFKRMKVKDIQLLKLTDTGGTSSMLLIGNVGTSSTGNVYEDFDIDDLLLYADPATADFAAPMLKVNVVSSNEFLRGRLKNINIYGDSGAGEWVADIRRAKDCEIDIKVRGATRGLSLASPLNVRGVVDCDGSTSDGQITTSRGGCTIRVAEGTVLDTSGAHATDRIGRELAIPDVQVFTSSGTWTKPAGVTTVQVELIAGGGGGGGGRRSASGTVAAGGGGGGGGGAAQQTFPASALAATETVTIGAGGTAGASAGADNTDGGAGGGGGNSSFGTTVKLRATLGGGGGGGTTSAGASGSNGGGQNSGGSGGAASGTGGAGANGSAGNMGAAGGGAGGGVTTAPAANAGGSGGSSVPINIGGGTAGSGANGGAGGNAPAGLVLPGAGGGGGGANAAGAGFTGGAGGTYGAGGGGGGGCLNGNASGAGGAGAGGICIVTSW